MYIQPLRIFVFLVASAAAAFAQGAADLPARRPGLWEEVVIDRARPLGTPAPIFRICVDATTDRLSLLVPENVPLQNCREHSLRRNGDRRIATLICGSVPNEIIVTTVIEGDYPTRYVAHRGLSMVRAGRTIHPFGNGRRFEGRWASQTCGHGLVPGDVVRPSGLKTHRNGAPLMPMP